MHIFDDLLHRIAYSFDASVYREMPCGVAYPESDHDIVELIGEARRRGCCLIPRAGGTSIAGQVVGNGIVVDVSRHMNHIIEINPDEKWVRVQPGVVRDELNMVLKEYGLFFSPETSTSNRCCIGGMVGNNSCGTHSLVYGSTRQHVLQLKGFLSDGTKFDTVCRGEGELEKKIYQQLKGWQNNAETQRLLKENYPDASLKRRSCGYAIDEVINICSVSNGQVDKTNNKGIDLCKLICGSEGTLCFITEIKLSLNEIPPKENMVLCAHCNSLEDSFEANLIALKHNPVAVELMDGKILELSKGNIAANRNRFFVEGNPAALLIAEFNGPDMDMNANETEKELHACGLAYTCTRVYNKNVSRVWALRKAGLGILNGMKGDAKPVGVIEDTAVAPQRLTAYMKDFTGMLSRLNVEGCVYYGHISTGELHLRPILNLKTEKGRVLFRHIAEETALLVRKHRGSLSGEHGDGRLRGEFIPLMYGNECYEMMRQVKKCWDSDGVFNSNKIVDAPGMDEWLRYQVGQNYAVENDGGLKTGFNWKSAFDDCKVKGVSGVKSQTHALMSSIEQCNGAGECRKSNRIGGTMCPAFKVSMDELKSTRARANVLRELLTYGLDNGKWNDKRTIKEIKSMLDTCLSCKGCKSECPSSVDMTRIRAELLYQIYKAEGTPLRSWAISRMHTTELLGSHVRPLYNFLATWHPSAHLIKQCVGFSDKRSIPTISPRKLRHGRTYDVKTHIRNGKTVCVFLDEFSEIHDTSPMLKFVELLQQLGYAVLFPKHVESGRAAISKGCLDIAKKNAIANVKLLKDIINDDCQLVGIEPSCILSFRDEYPDLVSLNMRNDARKLAENCLLYDEFLIKEIKAGRIDLDSFKRDKIEIWLHGHCHQKALVGIDKTADLLKTLLPDSIVNVIPSGCCGMAGSFGYEKEHYETSMEIGEMVLFPTIRNAISNGNEKVIIVAPGTSCRQQIFDGTGVKALHPVEVLCEQLKTASVD